MTTKALLPDSALLRFQDVSFRRGSRLLLDNLSFTLHAGSCTALIGPNGVGKTTLLRLAAGLLTPDSGSVSLADSGLHTMPRQQIARRIALVPQRLEVPFDFTVEEIVALGRHPHRSLLRALTAKDRQAMERAMEATDTISLRHRRFNELSGGERQRGKIALGLAQEPEVLLLDEPAQSLDIGRQLELLALIRRLSRNGITILAAMHELALIEGVFAAVMLLREDAPMLHGAPAEVLRPGILEEAFHCPPQGASERLLTSARIPERPYEIA